MNKTKTIKAKKKGGGLTALRQTMKKAKAIEALLAMGSTKSLNHAIDRGLLDPRTLIKCSCGAMVGIRQLKKHLAKRCPRAPRGNDGSEQSFKENLREIEHLQKKWRGSRRQVAKRSSGKMSGTSGRHRCRYVVVTSGAHY